MNYKSFDTTVLSYLCDNTWHDITVVCQNGIILYIDGVGVNTTSMNFAYRHSFFKSINSDPLSITDIRVYNYPLTSTQIQHLFDPRKHLQIRFSFDTWTSSSGNIIENNGLLGPWSEYHGYITNGTVLSSDYAVGSKCLMVGNVFG